MLEANWHRSRLDTPRAVRSHDTKSPAAWIFQANPDHFARVHSLEVYLNEAAAGRKNVTWYVGQRGLGEKMREGQPVFVWRAAGTQKAEPGIIARGSIAKPPQDRGPLAWERKYEAHEAHR